VIETKMELTPHERDLLSGAEGETMQKIMETLARYGDAFGAKRFVPLDGPAHLVGTYAIIATKPYVELLDQLVEEGIKTKLPFTGNPLPLDYDNIACTEEEKRVFDRIYVDQARLEANLAKIGMENPEAYTCACYLDEVGNTPKRGDNLAWAESSAVVYANSVLGARTNRNSGIIDLFCAIVGKAPQFGLLTDEGRKAHWIIELKTTKLPGPHALGSAIGLKVMEEIPYIRGLDQYLGQTLDSTAKDYLKEMGSSTASNGAVGLYHVENLTPEAKDFGEILIRPGAKTYVIDDAELERVVASYPLMWDDPEGAPEMAFIGCPHYSYSQLCTWTELLEAELKKQNREQLAVNTVFLAALPVLKKLKESDYYPRLRAMGAALTHICPLLYTANPLCAGKRIITNSNKLRTYSLARYVGDEDLVRILVRGEMGS